MNKVKLTIVTPAYNAEKYIADLYNSIKRNIKNKGDIEWVIVNDGSTDKTLKIIRAFKENWVKVFTKKNGGLGSSRTYGLNKSSGEYVWHMDSDDLFVDGALAKVMRLIKDSKYDLIKVADNHYDDVTKEVRPEKLYSLKSLKKSPHVWPQGLIVKKEIIPKGFSFFPKNGDLAYMYVFDILDWSKFYLLNERVVNYRVNVENSMSTSKNINVDLRASKYNFILSETLNTKRYVKKSIKRSCFDYAYALFINKTKTGKISEPGHISKLPVWCKIIIIFVKITPKFIAKMALN